MKRRNDNTLFNIIATILVVAILGAVIYYFVDKRNDDEITSENSFKATVDDYTASNEVYTVTELTNGIFKVNYTMTDDSAAYSYVSVSMTAPENLAVYNKMYIKFKATNMSKLHIKFGDGSKTVSNLTGKTQTVVVNFNEATINTAIKLFLDSYELDSELYNDNNRSLEVYEIGFIS